MREVLSSWVQLKDIVRLQEIGNDKLKRRLADLAAALDDDYEVNFELITTGELTPSAKNDVETFQEQITADEDLPATIHIVDKEELKSRYDAALERQNQLLIIISTWKRVGVSQCNWLKQKSLLQRYN